MNYAITTLILLSVILGFFIGAGWAAGQYRQFGPGQTAVRVLVALPLLLSGIVLHFFRLQETVSIIPPGVPAPVFLVKLTGVLEIVGAIGIFVPAWRRRAALLLAVMMVAVFPANVYVAGRTVGGMQMPGVPLRTAMQVVFILLILLGGFGIPGTAAANRKTIA